MPDAPSSRPSLVVPSAIPWADLKQEHLEELLYWLLDDLGLKDLLWRRGGRGRGAADGGRDIEGTLQVATTLGEFQPQRWWVEAKGRSGTVEAQAVQFAVHNATGIVDVLVIATNSQFSNPTHDWVQQWQAIHPRPKVWLWQRETLERQICQHPAVAARLFSSALSIQGRLDLLTSRFWNSLHFASPKDLETLWDGKAELDWSARSMVAVVVGEAASGDHALRPWLAEMPEESMLDLLVVSLGNVLSLSYRADRYGVSTDPLLDGFAHIALAAALVLSPEECATIAENPWAFSEGHPAARAEVAPVLRELMIAPILRTAAHELADACARQCERIAILDATARMNGEARNYWRRFTYDDTPASKADRRTLYIEESKKPCRVGFALDSQKRCPIMNRNVSQASLDDTFETFARILRDLVARKGIGSDDTSPEGVKEPS